MRKTFSSLFILIVLTICLWTFGAWFFGKQNSDALFKYIDKNQLNENAIVHLEMKEFSSSIISAKGRLAVRLNENYPLNTLINDNEEEWILNFTVKHGPFLINKTGFNIGKSVWEITIDEQNENLFKPIKEVTDSKINKRTQLPSAIIRHSFDDLMKYSLTFNRLQFDMKIKGIVDLKTGSHNGSMRSPEIVLKKNDITTKLSNIEFKYKNVSIAENGSYGQEKLYIRTILPEWVIKHKNMDAPVTLNAIHNGSFNLNGHILDGDNTLELNALNQTRYPFDKGIFDFNIDSLNLNKFAQLIRQFKHIQNLEEQSQWILEEQGELPEGQDQIWQRQDQAKIHKQRLPNIAKEAFLTTNTNKPIFTFKLLNNYQSNKSKLNGFLDIVNEGVNHSRLNSETNESLFSNLVKVNANVSLDKILYDFISNQIPINNNTFTLIYKNNQLLMQ